MILQVTEDEMADILKQGYVKVKSKNLGVSRIKNKIAVK